MQSAQTSLQGYVGIYSLLAGHTSEWGRGVRDLDQGRQVTMQRALMSMGTVTVTCSKEWSPLSFPNITRSSRMAFFTSYIDPCK